MDFELWAGFFFSASNNLDFLFSSSIKDLNFFFSSAFSNLIFLVFSFFPAISDFLLRLIAAFSSARYDMIFFLFFALNSSAIQVKNTNILLFNTR